MTLDLTIRKAKKEDISDIWPIFEQGIAKRREEGSSQWQDGYPNVASVTHDIENGHGYVALDNTLQIVAYVALIFTGEPAYEKLEGNWLTDYPYAVIHRLVVSQEKKIKGLGFWMMERLLDICRTAGFQSLRVDTNYDNVPMLRVFEKLGFVYCGIVYFRGGAREAYEKVLL